MDRRNFIRNTMLASAGLLLTGSELFGNVIRYRVKRGDTLSELAVKHRTSVKTIKRLNRLNNDRILIGQYLIIPAPLSYKYIEHVVRETNQLHIEPRRWQYIITHHSAIDNGNAEAYHNYHLNEIGMENGLAYHFVIGNGIDSGDGQVETGNRWKAQLDGGHVHTEKYNKIGIGICLVGNLEKHKPTRKQIEALHELIAFLRGAIKTDAIRYAVHREIDGIQHTVCPGKYFPIKDYHRRWG